ncbi:Gfo/Idh/MocA family oxidoreductase [Sphingobacterium sp. SGG-5]|uniref:Gfo/Idh/MocA family oxidoreductase n=1 Tax=Sphingobacterium sp. SGG-5 TaxID=2710881 RepID=UPI0019CFDAD2|nr:Gfo/Idh/MocA family oxidoreductase [Sphingobacterium sp. SGG-5]
MMQPIITGILSYGMSGRVFHAPFIAQSRYFELRAIVERSRKQAKADYPDIISYDSVEAILADPDIELIIVNTPNDTHVAYAKQALLAGKHVLIEKPFAPTKKEAEELFALGEKVGKKVLPYHNRRFDSDFLSLKYVLDKGFVGKPIELHLRFDRFKPELSPKIFKETSKRAASGVLYDLGSHLLDQSIALFGKPKSVVKIKSKHRPHSRVDDYATLLLSYEQGLNVFITTSLLVANPQKSFVLHGDRGSYIKDRTDTQERQLMVGMKPDDAMYGLEDEQAEGLLTIIEKGQREDIIVPSLKGDYMLVFAHAFETIRNNAPYYVTPEQIIWQLDILSSVR